MKLELSYKQARTLAEKIKAVLAPTCEHIEIAGSIRRKKETIGDIELVVIPKPNNNLFGPCPNLPTKLDNLLTRLVLNDNRLIAGKKSGPLYKQFYLPAMPNLQIDLFITTPEKWPIIYSIRTGSASFSQKIVTQVAKGGLLLDHYSVSGGHVWLGGQVVNLKSELEFFNKCLACGWVEPHERR
jgi:DNA polymerase/3'-5' exonuclease PolX